MTLDTNVLEQAKGFLHSQGWGRGDLVCDNGKVCALGALHLALGSTVKVTTETEGGATFTYYDIEYPYGPPPQFEGVKGESFADMSRRFAAFQQSDEYQAWRNRQLEYTANSKAYEEALNEVVTGLTADAANPRSWVADWNDLDAQDISDVERVFDLAIENINQKESVLV